MNARVHSSILQGIDAIACEVEADVVESADSETNIRLVGLVGHVAHGRAGEQAAPLWLTGAVEQSIPVSINKLPPV